VPPAVGAVPPAVGAVPPVVWVVPLAVGAVPPADNDAGFDQGFAGGPPVEDQFEDVRFVANRMGKENSIFVDGAEFYYRIHRHNRLKTRRWYRCTLRRSVNCPATACYDVAAEVIVSLSHPHNHSPALLPAFAR